MGSLMGFTISNVKKIAESRSDFGALPMQATFDINMDDKLRLALQNKVLDIDKNYKHFVMLILQLVGKTSMLRGGKEVSVCFLFIVMEK